MPNFFKWTRIFNMLNIKNINIKKSTGKNHKANLKKDSKLK